MRSLKFGASGTQTKKLFGILRPYGPMETGKDAMLIAAGVVQVQILLSKIAFSNLFVVNLLTCN